MGHARFFKALIVALVSSLIVGTGNFKTYAAQDNNVLWDYLYHGAATGNPRTEFVPGETFTFLDVGSSGLVQPSASVTVYALTDWMDTTGMSVRYWDTAEHWVSMTWVKNITTAFHSQPSRKYDLWKAVLPGQPLGRTVYYRIRVTDGSANAYLKAGGGTYTNPLGQVVRSTNDDPNDYSYTVVTPPPAWAQDAVIYYIFPDRFRNGDTSNDPANNSAKLYGDTTACGVTPCVQSFHSNWNDAVNGNAGEFFGGDLKGITDKLDYIKELGANTIYLTPIFAAQSNHGYDTNDYYAVAARFGGLTAFKNLITAAHDRGMRVIVDGVYGHAGSASKYVDAYGKNRWTEIGACESTSATFRTWFQSGVSDGGCAGGWKWRPFLGDPVNSTLAEYNESDTVKNFFYKGGNAASPGGVAVVTYWQTQQLDNVIGAGRAPGIDGWRFDAVQTKGWWAELRGYATNNGARQPFLIAELTGGCSESEGLPAAYGTQANSTQFDSAMNYCLMWPIINFATGGNPTDFDGRYNYLRGVQPIANWNVMFNMISTHDVGRVLTHVGGVKQSEKLAVLLQMTLPGAPAIYYGDEVGLSGGSFDGNRKTFPWGSGDTDMCGHYKTVISVRNGHSALRGGYFKSLMADNTSHVLSFLRWNGSEKIVVALNNGGSNSTVDITVAGDIPDGTVLNNLLNGGTVTVSGGKVHVTVNSKWGVILGTVGTASAWKTCTSTGLASVTSPATGGKTPALPTFEPFRK